MTRHSLDVNIHYRVTRKSSAGNKNVNKLRITDPSLQMDQYEASDDFFLFQEIYKCIFQVICVHWVFKQRSVFHGLQPPYKPLEGHSSCHAITKKVFELAGIREGNQRKGLHLLRHHTASKMISMELLGHENEATTKTFYAFATVDMLYDAIAKSNPEIANDRPQWKTEEILSRLYSF